MNFKQIKLALIALGVIASTQAMAMDPTDPNAAANQAAPHVQAPAPQPEADAQPAQPAAKAEADAQPAANAQPATDDKPAIGKKAKKALKAEAKKAKA